ncbi:DUF6029 family protein [Calditrichota bacterium LG25]
MNFYKGVLILLFLCVQALLAQISVRNQLEFTHWQSRDLDILENWTDVTYQRDWLQIGGRFEINEPPDPTIFPQDTLLKRHELTFAYARIRHRFLDVTVGNYYAMFGRGLTLRTYEDRNLRVDNNLLGAKVALHFKKLKFQALSGRMRDKYNRRKEWLSGADVELKASRSFKIGTSYLYQHNPQYFKDQKGMWSARTNFTHDLFDLYTEVVKPQWSPAFSYYVAVSTYGDKWNALLELKDYNRLSFQNAYLMEYNAAPSLTREHAFSLLNRHPHFLNQNDERGYQLEVNYNPSMEMQFVFNHSQTFTHDRRRIFQEYYLEMTHYWKENFEYHALVDWNFDFSTNTENITAIFDAIYNLTRRDQLHISIQHQHTKNKLDLSEYDNELALIEYSRSPWVSFALVGEYTNKYQIRNVQMDRHQWLYGQVSFNFWKNQRLSVLYGTRREGFICVGGICRYEPEFEGLEIKLTNRF